MSLSDELRRALRDGVADVTAHPDVAGLGAALSAADRRRRRRALVVTGVVASVLVVSAVAGTAAIDTGRDSISTPPAGRPPATAPGVDAGPGPAPVPSPPVEQVSDPGSPPVTPVEAPAAAIPPKVPLTGAAPPEGSPEKAPDPAPSPPKPDPGPATLTASAAYGSCSEDPPYDDYSGTAPAGGLVKLVSPYSAPVLVTADAGGHWSARVHFPSAPVGVPFTVTVGSPGTNLVQLTFTRTA